MKLIVKMSGQEAHAAIEGGTLLKLIESLTDDGAPRAEAPVEEPPKETPKKKASKKSKPAAKDPEPAPAPEPPTTVVEPEPEQPIVEAPAAPAQAPAYSIDDLQKAAVALVNKGKMAELQALLKEFNVSAITQLPDDAPTRAAFMSRVEAIGGQA